MFTMKPLLTRRALLAGCIAAAMSLHAPAAFPNGASRAKAIAALKEKHSIDGKEPAIEEIRLEDRLLNQVAESGFNRERRYYTNFAEPSNYFIVTEPDGSLHAAHFHADKGLVFDREISQDVSAAIRRLYQPTGHIRKDFFDIKYDLKTGLTKDIVDNLNSTLPENLRINADAIKAVHGNLREARRNADSFLSAIDLLSKDPAYHDEKVSAALWYVANMKEMGYAYRDDSERMQRALDLHEMDAVTFYENVHYAVKARNQSKWGKNIPWDIFLRNVLPARNTSEPVQTWRRLYFEALEPFMKKAKTQEEAMGFIHSLTVGTYNYVQTTFEDQSQFLGLAMHAGRCEEQVNYGACLVRAVGAPANEIRVPAWAKGNGNHAWFGTPIRARDGTLEDVLSWMPGDENGDNHDLYKNSTGGDVPAKVYMVDPFDNKEDVTRHFTSAKDLKLKVAKPETTHYLNVINTGVPVSVAVAKSDADRNLVFKNVGNKDGIVYLISTNPQSWQTSAGSVEQAIAPFVFEEDGSVKMLQTDSDLSDETTQAQTFRMREDADIKNPNQEYRLGTWKGSWWQPVDDASYFKPTPKDGSHVLNVPLAPNRLYHFFIPNAGMAAQSSQGRPFIASESEVKRY